MGITLRLGESLKEGRSGGMVLLNFGLDFYRFGSSSSNGSKLWPVRLWCLPVFGLF